MFSPRHHSRELAVQALYQLQMLESQEDPNKLDLFWEHFDAPENTIEFATELIQGVIDHLTEIDDSLIASLENWKLDRLPVLVQILLRVAVYELLFGKSAPFQVIINEALELARDFVDEPSRVFVNRVLQKIQDSQNPSDQEK